jgi:hypothetical protein
MSTQPSEPSRQDAEDAFNTLTELIGNIDGAIFTLAEALDSANDRTLDHMMFVHIYRMTLSWVILSLAKTKELWERFGRLAGDETKVSMRAILKEIDARRIVSLRNKTIAHLLDKDTNQPMSPEKIQEGIAEMVRGDLKAFIHWVRHPEGGPDGVTSVLRRFRDEIQTQFPDIRNYNEVQLAPGQSLGSLPIAGPKIV